MTTTLTTEIQAIEVTGLTKRFDPRGGTSRVALEDVSFTVAPGRTIAVVGESGAGKTTLVRCVAGLEKPTLGEIRINGEPLVLRPGRVSPVGMVFQNPTDALDPMRSIGASVAEPLRGMSRSERRTRVTELLSLVGISAARAKERPKSFSGGQLQRVVIARGLASDPEVLLCDEPTSALDVSIQGQIVNLLLRLQAEHRFAGIVVTHDLAVARVLADDALVLKAGRVVFHGSVEEMIDGSGLADPYVASLVDASRNSEVGQRASVITAKAS
ncbi:dipeptide/oligopeptide/nickel ABC transporter ATP-binding protein [Saccharomonospora sp. NPDC006951]